MSIKRCGLLLFFMLLLNPCLSDGLLTKFEPGYAISTLVKHSDLVVVGRVTDTQFVFRDNMLPKFTTDITLAVESIIKGEANIDENTVKFMIKGGRGVNPHLGRELNVIAQHSPKFALNERVLVFLRKGRRANFQYPYGDYFVFRGRLGKRAVSSDKILMPYTVSVNAVNPRTGNIEQISARKFINLSVDLVVEMGKASVRDFEAAQPLDAEIKTIVSQAPGGVTLELDEETTTRLQNESTRILSEEDDNPE